MTRPGPKPKDPDERLVPLTVSVRPRDYEALCVKARAERCSLSAAARRVIVASLRPAAPPRSP